MGRDSIVKSKHLDRGAVMLFFHSFFTTDIYTRKYKTHHVFRFLNSSPKSPEIIKIGHRRSPEFVSRFLEWGTRFPERYNRFPKWGTQLGYLVSQNEYPVSLIGYPVIWRTAFYYLA